LYSDQELSPLLNLGSSTRTFREREQPWISEILLAALAQRAIRIVHTDVKSGEGVDLQADIMDEGDFQRIRVIAPRAMLVCNLLEHVENPRAFVARCLAVLPPGGLVFVTVPYSYPFHRDPIDTMLRPNLADLTSLFSGGADCLFGEIIDVGESYRNQLANRPWIVFRHVLRLPVPFLGIEKWRRSMGKLRWLVQNYRVTCAVFRKT
jgi:hypothetical protein